MDYAHDKTDQMLDDLEKELTALYTETNEEITKRVLKLTKLIADEEDQSKRLELVNRKNQLNLLLEQITLTLNKTNLEAIALAQKMWVNTYDLNYKYGAYLVETTIDDLGVFPILDKSAINAVVTQTLTPASLVAIDNVTDKAQILKSMKTAIVQGVTLGDSNQNIAKRIAKETGKSYNQSMQIARTETTRIEGSGRYDSFKYAKDELGLKIEKQWVATLDERTRPTHRKLDGQIIEVDADFEIKEDGGTTKAKYPADFAKAKESINCRCTIITRIKGFETKLDMPYDEWENAR